MRAVTIRALVTGALALAVLACGQTPSTPRPTTPGQPTGSPRPLPVSTPDSSPSDPVREDVTLLSLLPAEIDGARVEVEPLGFQDALLSPDFVASVEAAVFLVVVREPDLAGGVVARIRPGFWGDAPFRDWRDSCDEGACAPAGGTAGRAEVQLGGRTVYITSCAEDLKVYHAHLEDGGRDLIVSLFSLGEKRYGEQLMAGLGA